jgi:hypothetical protein
MKRYFEIFIIALSAICLSVSCDKNEANGSDDFGEKGYITIRFSGSKLTTKATEAGKNELNENLVSYVDIFFYPTGQTGSNSVLSFLGKHVTAVTGEADTYEVKIRYTDDQATALFGSTTTGSCDAYVIANGPTRTYGTSTTVADLKKTVETQYFGSQTDGIQDNFVMDGQGTVTFTSGVPTGLINLDRAVAKISFYANLVEKVEVNEPASAAGEWKPVPAGIKISFRNATKTGYIDGTYTHTDDDYFNYDDRAMSTTVKGSLTVNGTTHHDIDFLTHTPFYSFPENWYDIDPHQCYLYLTIPWQRKTDSKVIYSYYQINANRIDRKLLRNTYYKIFTQISNLGSTDLNKPVLIDNDTYVIKDWGQVDVGEKNEYIPGSFEKYSYLVVSPKNIDLYNQNSTSMFYSSSSDITVTVTKVERKKYSDPSGPLDDDITSPDPTVYKFTVDKDNTKIIYTHDQSNIFVLETIYATVTNGEGMSEDIIITQRPAIYISEIPGDNVFVNGYFGHVANATFGDNNDTNSSDTPGVYMCCHQYSDTYNNYQVYNDGTGADLSVHYGYDNYYENIYSGYGTVMKNYSNVSGSINCTYITDIHVTAFNNTNNSYTVTGEAPKKYKIGDPRIKASSASITGSSWNVNPYLTGETGREWNYNKGWIYQYTQYTAAWSLPENILVTSQNSVDQNILAPEFYISSSWNAMVQNKFATIVYRAATYQEAGYPAGRWRLPTEAEIAFIRDMQERGKIPTLFSAATGSYYWAASGRYYDSAAKRFVTASANTTASCRFVYDTWYWGSTAAATNVYHPNGHNTTY